VVGSLGQCKDPAASLFFFCFCFIFLPQPGLVVVRPILEDAEEGGARDLQGLLAEALQSHAALVVLLRLLPLALLLALLLKGPPAEGAVPGVVPPVVLLHRRGRRMAKKNCCGVEEAAATRGTPNESEHLVLEAQTKQLFVAWGLAARQAGRQVGALQMITLPSHRETTNSESQPGGSGL